MGPDKQQTLPQRQGAGDGTFDLADQNQTQAPHSGIENGYHRFIVKQSRRKAAQVMPQIIIFTTRSTGDLSVTG